MKVNVEIDCSPEEARRFLGLPDVSPVNEAYVESMVDAMKGAGSIDQMQSMVQSIAPMGEMGLRMFQRFMENAASTAMGGGSSGSKK